MKVAVVGGTGNISGAIVRLLLDLGHEVVCFNRGRSGPLPDGARLIAGERNHTHDFERAMQREKLDAAIDMICYNAEHAHSTIRAFRGVGHLVVCSTVATYDVNWRSLPVTEDHPLTTDGPYGAYGRDKVAADRVLLEAYQSQAVPVTLVKPSATYGPVMGLPRQVARDAAWIDRIRKGKPIIVCGDGMALQQFLHVDDAALGFAHLLGRSECVGQTYNLVPAGFTYWATYHRTVMQVLGRTVELVGVPAEVLRAVDAERFRLCISFDNYFSNAKLVRDVPEFRPRIPLEQGVAHVLQAWDRDGRIPDADADDWEDRIIAAQRRVRSVRLD